MEKTYTFLLMLSLFSSLSLFCQCSLKLSDLSLGPSGSSKLNMSDTMFVLLPVVIKEKPRFVSVALSC